MFCLGIANFCISCFYNKYWNYSDWSILYTCVECVCAQSPQTCPTLCDPMDCSLPGSSVRGILQARILEWVAVPSSRGSSRPGDQTGVFCVSCTAAGFSPSELPGKPYALVLLKSKLREKKHCILMNSKWSLRFLKHTLTRISNLPFFPHVWFTDVERWRSHHAMKKTDIFQKAFS